MTETHPQTLSTCTTPPRKAGLRCVGVELNTHDPAGLARFYAGALSFSVVRETQELVELTLERCLLRLRRVRGRTIPADSRSNDHWFRHLAIVVRDMAAAFEHIKSFSPRAISSKPQMLPSWNAASGGIQAFYFRDPEGHPLELIHFPQGKGRSQWQQPGQDLYQGVDHTAIVVSSAAASVDFYHSFAQLSPGAVAHNYGVEQEALSQLRGADLHATSLTNTATQAPSLELLEYKSPRDGRAVPADTSAEDVWSSATLFAQHKEISSAGSGTSPHSIGELDPDGYRAVLL